ncbi:MAG: PspC domain-containing protein [Chloroflexota bacterium]
MTKRLHKSRTERMIAGVCGGLAEYFDVDPVFMRLAFVLLAFLTGIGFLLYPLLWIIMPEEGSIERPPRDVVRENLDRMREDAERLGEQLRTTTGGSAPAAAGTASESQESSSEPRGDASLTVAETPTYSQPRPAGDRQFIAGVIVLLLGVLLLLQNLNLFWWASLWRLWPLLLVAVGAFLLYRQVQARQ